MDKSKLDDETVVVGFELPAQVAAGQVSVCGEFNGWSGQSHPLTRLDDGHFRTDITLPAGQRWRFRYLLDGERWENDWAADDYVPNGLGQDDSVVDLTDTASLPLAIIAAAQAEVEAAARARTGTAAPAGAEGEGEATVAAQVADEETTEETDGGREPGLLTRWWRWLTFRGRCGRRAANQDTAAAVAPVELEPAEVERPGPAGGRLATARS